MRGISKWVRFHCKKSSESINDFTGAAGARIAPFAARLSRRREKVRTRPEGGLWLWNRTMETVASRYRAARQDLGRKTWMRRSGN